jgi:hypothetical protein
MKWIRALRRLVLVTQPLLATHGCVHPSDDTIVAFAQVDSRRDRRSDVILPTEFRSLAGATAADAVRLLRPEFLRAVAPRSISGGASFAVVFVDNHRTGGFEALATVPLAIVVEIRYLSPMTAKGEFGSHCPCEGGAIVVKTGVLAPP